MIGKGGLGASCTEQGRVAENSLFTLKDHAVRVSIFSFIIRVGYNVCISEYGVQREKDDGTICAGPFLHISYTYNWFQLEFA